MAVMPKFTGLLALCLCATAAIASPLPADNGVGTVSVTSPLGSPHIPRANSLPTAGNLGSDTVNAASVLGVRRVVDVEPVVDNSLNTDDKHSRREAKDDTVLNANAIDRVTSTYHRFEDNKRAPKHDQVVGAGGALGLASVSYHNYSDKKRDMGPPAPAPPAAFTFPTDGITANLAKVELRQAPPPPKGYTVTNPNVAFDLVHLSSRQNTPPSPPREMSIPVTKSNLDIVDART